MNGNMDQNPFSQSHQAVQSVSEPPEAVATSNGQQPQHAAAPPYPSSRTYSRTAIRKSKPPSCNLCRRRKIKCDRADPCSHCVRVDAVCVSSAPSGAPRGRQGGRRKLDSELLDRIAKLENLVNHIEGATTGATPPVPAVVDGIHTVPEESDFRAPKMPRIKSGPKSPKEGLDRYLGSSLWMNLSDEASISGMREVLNQSSDDEDCDSSLTPGSSEPSFAQCGQSNFVLYAPDILSDMGSPLKHPTRSQVHSLFSSFTTNVEPAVKMLHTPSLRRYFIEESGELDCSPGPKGWDALKFAIYYTTITSLTPTECLQRLGEEKSVLLPRYRSSTEFALARADFVNTEDVSTLQALVLYLFAIRSNDHTRRTWTLISLAVRIAHALGLHRERSGGKYTSPHLPFEREMRRRLWWQICVLDRQASADRGSDPIITTNSFSTPFPLHVTDEDLIPDSPYDVQSREEYTDMTLSLVCHEVFDIERRLNYVPAGEFDRSEERSDDPWSQRRGWVIASQRRVEERYLRYCSMDVPVQRFTLLVAHIIIATMWLFAYRPLQRHPDSPTSVKIPHPGILHLSVEVIEKAIQLSVDTSTGPFSWISTIWVQWHALAVMIAELCVQTKGPTVERAWSVVETVFEETARHVADSDKGRLWRPIKKLMNKAQAVRRKHLADLAARTGCLINGHGGDQKPAHQAVSWAIAQPPEVSVLEIEPDSKLLGNTNGLVQQPQQNATNTETMPLNWDQWLATTQPDQMDYNNEMNQMAWTNWEAFVDDFQANGDFSPGAGPGIQPSFNMW